MPASEWPEQIGVSAKLGSVSWAQPQAHAVFDTVPLGLALQLYLCRHTVWTPAGRKLVLGEHSYDTVLGFYHFLGRVCGSYNIRRVQPVRGNLGNLGNLLKADTGSSWGKGWKR